MTDGRQDDPSPARHYFDERPDVARAPAVVDVVLPGTAFRLTTDRGVFSHGRLDTGTALLLREAQPPALTGQLLDLGCGAGPITLTLAKRAPDATVWAVDVNERARELTSANAQANGVTNVRIVHPDDVPVDIVFATIWSNPPIRIGKRSLHDLLLTWLPRLAPGGRAELVVQKHLGADSLHHWLEQQGFTVRRTASRSGYRLLAVE
ncbi:MAG: class I SAM-dependent methyltransferase [Ilumatobacteraceae bacterium]